MTLGEQLRKTMKARGMTYEVLSRRTLIPLSTIYRALWDKGVSLEYLLKIVSVLKPKLELETGGRTVCIHMRSDTK